MSSGGTTTARLKLEGIDGRAHHGVEPVAQFESTRSTALGQSTVVSDRVSPSHDAVQGGAWPLVVRGLTCLALIQLTSEITTIISLTKYNRTACAKQDEGCSNNRSVMPLDALGRTRATM